MTTLPTAPDDAKALSYGTSMNQTYLVRRVNFGDQYSQRAQKGLNAKPQVWKLIWTKLPDASAEELRVLFEGLGGSGIVNWTPFNQTTELKWSANGFDSKPSGYLRTDCSVTFTQEFDL
jgi:phage-related protein